jgi:hypothetical protein
MNDQLADLLSAFAASAIQIGLAVYAAMPLWALFTFLAFTALFLWGIRHLDAWLDFEEAHFAIDCDGLEDAPELHDVADAARKTL